VGDRPILSHDQSHASHSEALAREAERYLADALERANAVGATVLAARIEGEGRE
jgi:hypothetical protein